MTVNDSVFAYLYLQYDTSRRYLAISRSPSHGRRSTARRELFRERRKPCSTISPRFCPLRHGACLKLVSGKVILYDFVSLLRSRLPPQVRPLLCKCDQMVFTSITHRIPLKLLPTPAALLALLPYYENKNILFISYYGFHFERDCHYDHATSN